MRYNDFSGERILDSRDESTASWQLRLTAHICASILARRDYSTTRGCDLRLASRQPTPLETTVLVSHQQGATMIGNWFWPQWLRLWHPSGGSEYHSGANDPKCFLCLLRVDVITLKV